jgi:hypothetical protein
VDDRKTLRKCVVQGVNKKALKNQAGPIGVSYSRKASSKMFSKYLKDKVKTKVVAQENKKER